jgi:hypothetical protein
MVGATIEALRCAAERSLVGSSGAGSVNRPDAGPERVGNVQQSNAKLALSIQT